MPLDDRPPAPDGPAVRGPARDGPVVSGEPAMRVGLVVRLAEDDYRFGLGTLVLRVEAVHGVRHLDDGPWLAVRGVQIFDGRDGPVREEVLVRMSALPPG